MIVKTFVSAIAVGFNLIASITLIGRFLNPCITTPSLHLIIMICFHLAGVNDVAAASL